MIWFETSIITGHTDYTKEEWDAWWNKRKDSGYIVIDSFKMADSSKIKLCDVKFKKYRVLDLFFEDDNENR